MRCKSRLYIDGCEWSLSAFGFPTKWSLLYLRHGQPLSFTTLPLNAAQTTYDSHLHGTIWIFIISLSFSLLICLKCSSNYFDYSLKLARTT